MKQQPLIPIQVLYEAPSEHGTADLKVLGRGDDGFDYAIKRTEDHAMLPISEWIGYRLCEAVGIPTPESRALLRENGTVAFGSRIEANYSMLDKTKVNNPVSLVQFFGAHVLAINAIYAIDAFLPNDDRHGRNMMIRNNPTGDLLLAFDFSRSWLVLGSDAIYSKDWQKTLPNSSNTKQWWAALKQLIKASAGTDTLDAIANLPDDWLMQQFREAPKDWLAGVPVRKCIRAWKMHRKARAIQAAQWLA